MASDSEFVCEVVRVESIEPHPNADRLSIIRVAGKAGPMGYTLVSGDDYSPGDLAILVGVDSLVPIDRPEWGFCKKRLDYKTGSSHYRIRRAKLRGIQTDGVLLKPYFPVSLGDDVSVSTGILKYETPEQIRLNNIEKSDKGPPRAPNKWRRLIPDYSVINLRKVSKLFDEGELVEISEKIHGSNIRFGRVGSRLYVASHHVIKSDMRSWWQRFVDRLFRRTRSAGHWYGSDIWSKWVADNINWKQLPDGLIFYGEIFGGGIQGKFNYGFNDHQVRVFDIWSIHDQAYIGFYQKKVICADAGIDSVDARLTVYQSDKLVEWAAEPSKFTTNHIREGVVVKSLDGARRGKYVSDAYKEAV